MSGECGGRSMQDPNTVPTLFQQCIDYLTALLVRAPPSERQPWYKHIAGLPLEVVEKLLAYLAAEELLDDDLLSLTCLAHAEHAFLDGCVRLSWPALAQLAHCDGLRVLELRRCSQVDDALIDLLTRSCPRLHKLDIAENRKVSNQSLLYLAARSTALETLNILKCGTPERLNHQGVGALHKCSKLRKLNIGWCKRMTDEALYQIASDCPALEALDLWLVEGLTGPGLQRIAPLLLRLKKINLWAVNCVDDDTVRALATHCKAMESVNFQANAGLTDAAFVKKHVTPPATANGPKDDGTTNGHSRTAPLFGGSLKKLVLTACKGLTGQAIVALAASSPMLQKFNLVECKVTDREIQRIVEYCPALVRLDLERTEITSASIRYIINARCHNTLRTLNLWGCTDIDDDALELLAAHCGDSLRKLHLVDNQISDAGLKRVLQHHPALRVVSVGGEDMAAHAISDDSLISLSCLPLLRKLELFNIEGISDRCLIPVLSRCRGIKTLRIVCADATEAVTDAAGRLLAGLKALSELDLIGLRHVTDATVAVAAFSCTRLASLELGTMPQLTSASFAAIAQDCHRLRSLTLHDIGITTEDVSALIARCTRLEQLDLDQEAAVDPALLVVSSPLLTVTLPEARGGGFLTRDGLHHCQRDG